MAKLIQYCEVISLQLKKKYWSGLPFHLPGDLPDPGIEPVPPMFPALAGEFFIV